MSTPFTAVADWPKRGQDLAAANELVLAYSERRQVLGQSAVDLLTAGVNAQDKTLWLEMMNWLEANCTTFVDYVNGPLNGGSTDFLYYTLATWRAAAGLNASGFRRRLNPSDADSFGVIQTGDARGKWCFEDIQKGLDTLRWTVKLSEWIAPGTFYAAQQFAGDWATAKAAAEANYAAGTWAAGIAPNAYARLYNHVSWNGAAFLNRVKSTAAISNHPVAFAGVLYMWGNRMGVYYDNGDGVLEGVWTATGSESNATGAPSNYNWAGPTVGDTAQPLWGADPAIFTSSSRGYTSAGNVLIKNGFTNQGL